MLERAVQHLPRSTRPAHSHHVDATSPGARRANRTPHAAHGGRSAKKRSGGRRKLWLAGNETFSSPMRARTLPGWQSASAADRCAMLDRPVEEYRCNTRTADHLSGCRSASFHMWDRTADISAGSQVWPAAMRGQVPRAGEQVPGSGRRRHRPFLHQDTVSPSSRGDFHGRQLWWRNFHFGIREHAMGSFLNGSRCPRFALMARLLDFQ